jgi:hypothetical protein
MVKSFKTLAMEPNLNTAVKYSRILPLENVGTEVITIVF